jgi:hypothetical protein
MDRDPNAPNASYYLWKTEHYRDKAKVVTDASLKMALEALAREYEHRAREAAAAAVDPKAGLSNPIRLAQGSLHHR